MLVGGGKSMSLEVAPELSFALRCKNDFTALFLHKLAVYDRGRLTGLRLRQLDTGRPLGGPIAAGLLASTTTNKTKARLLSRPARLAAPAPG